MLVKLSLKLSFAQKYKSGIEWRKMVKNSRENLVKTSQESRKNETCLKPNKSIQSKMECKKSKLSLFDQSNRRLNRLINRHKFDPKTKWRLKNGNFQFWQIFFQSFSIPKAPWVDVENSIEPSSRICGMLIAENPRPRPIFSWHKFKLKIVKHWKIEEKGSFLVVFVFNHFCPFRMVYFD